LEHLAGIYTRDGEGPGGCESGVCMAEELEGVRSKGLGGSTVVNVKTVFWTIFINYRTIRIFRVLYKLLI
jgi:hypothetical protein